MEMTEGQAIEEIEGIAYSIGAWCAAGRLDSFQGMQAILTLTPEGDTPIREAALSSFERGEKHWEQFS